MSTMTTLLDWREGRRQRAWELKAQGRKQQDIAAALGVTPDITLAPSANGSSGDASRVWRGCTAIAGRQPRLTAEQVAQLKFCESLSERLAPLPFRQQERLILKDPLLGTGPWATEWREP